VAAGATERGSVSRAVQVARATPPDRNRYVDLLRAAAIVAVVVGHWLATALVVRGDQIGGQSILALVPATQWATWLFQVMPVFFLVGGYANAVSWDKHQQRRGGWASWLYRRTARLLTPTTVFIIAVTMARVAGRLAGVDEALLTDAAWLVGIALWFLAVYVAVVALAPPLLAAHRRSGWAWLAVMTVVAGGLDAIRLTTNTAAVAAPNFLLVWAAIHQLGFAWYDRRLVQPRWIPPLLAAGGIAALLILTVAGPYPVSMVAVPDAPVQNTSPPSMTLLALAIAQTGVILCLRGQAKDWLRRPRVWSAVVAVNAVVLTIFLWHFVPVVIAGPALYLTGVMPQPAIGSPAWFALRVVWVIVLGLLLVPLVATLGRFERPPARTAAAREGGGGRLATMLGAAGVPAVCLGLFVLTDAGFAGAGPAGLPLGGLLLYGTGIALLEASGQAAVRH
jgi:peptidoglycan/LPS O-acetylase OafA/YrhL